VNGHAFFTLATVGAMLLALVFEVMAPDVIVFSALGVLLLAGVLTPQEAFAGFANTGMLTVAVMFIVAYAAQTSGVLEFFANRVMGSETRGRRALLKMMLPVAGISAFLNNTPIVAMFTPAMRDWAIRRQLSPAKFLLPLSYAAIFGGICTLIGTSTNLVVNGLLIQEGVRSLSMFELGWVGLPCALAGVLYMASLGYRLLPDRPDLAEDFARSGREYLLEMKVPAGSPLAGRSVEEAGLRHLDQLFLTQIHRNGEILAPVEPNDRLEAGDHLVFTGQVDGIVNLQKVTGLLPSHEKEFCRDMFRTGGGKIVEAVVSRSSPMLGKTLREGNFRARYDAAVLAVHRHGERLTERLGQVMLKPGDTLLLLAGEDFSKRWNYSREFYMVSKVTEVPAVNSRKTLIALVSLSGMVLLAATGIMDILNAAVLMTMVLLITRCLTVVEARRCLELNVLIVIAASLGIGKALTKTGAAAWIAGLVIEPVQNLGPVGLLAAIYLCTAILTEVITNNAAAALVFPIAMAAAGQQGLDPMPFAIAVAIGASASFATPIGYQTNMMVYGPGGYRFVDFLKVGIPLGLLYMVVALTVIPLVWKF
jgi:di/tricarboxylate transporter